MQLPRAVFDSKPLRTWYPMTLLLTSFAPWKAHQESNSSDDLVYLLAERKQLPTNTILIRRLPVHFQLAPCQVLSALFQYKPDTVVCCGMAESRSLLNLERYGRSHHDRLETSLDLEQLCEHTKWTTISEDAGNYVCNALYFQLLAHIRQNDLATRALFIHVPPLNAYNREAIAQDLHKILAELETNFGKQRALTAPFLKTDATT